jgi:hypothetical protein
LSRVSRHDEEVSRCCREPTTWAFDEGKFTVEVQWRAIDDDTSGAALLALKAPRAPAV